MGLLSLYEFVHSGFVVSSCGWIIVFPGDVLSRFLFDCTRIQFKEMSFILPLCYSHTHICTYNTYSIYDVFGHVDKGEVCML